MTSEKIREYNRKYYQANKEKHKEKMKQYRLDHADEIKEYMRGYQNQYYKTQKGRAYYLIRTYNREDKSRGLNTSNNITADWIVQNIFSGQSCVYCGESDWRKLGVDRIDNDKPHTTENLVCCCKKCNVERNRRYTVEEFKKIKEIQLNNK